MKELPCFFDRFNEERQVGKSCEYYDACRQVRGKIKGGRGDEKLVRIQSIIKKEANITGYSVLGYNRNRVQYKIALELLKYVPIQGKVLDVACGFGEFADILKEIGFQPVCVDGADRLIKDVKQRGYEGYKVNLEYQRLPFGNNEFDIVVSLDTIEHLWNTRHYLAEIVRVLKPSGYAIFTTPNYNCWTYRIIHLLGNLEKVTYKNPHRKFYTAKSFRQELEKYFEIKKTLGKIHLPIIGIIQFHSKFQNLLSKNIGILGMPKKS